MDKQLQRRASKAVTEVDEVIDSLMNEIKTLEEAIQTLEVRLEEKESEIQSLAEQLKQTP